SVEKLAAVGSLWWQPCRLLHALQATRLPLQNTTRGFSTKPSHLINRNWLLVQFIGRRGAFQSPAKREDLRSVPRKQLRKSNREQRRRISNRFCAADSGARCDVGADRSCVCSL